jgi:hypothetical protein
MLNDIKEKSQIIVFSIDKDINNNINLDVEVPLRFRRTLDDFINEGVE